MYKKFIFSLTLFAFVSALFMTGTAKAAPAELLAWYKLDGNADDSSGNEYHGTPTDTVVWLDDPERGIVASFNGDDAAIETPVPMPIFNQDNDFSWAFWYKYNSDGSGGNDVILGNRSGGDGGMQFIKFTPSQFEYYSGGNEGIDYDDFPEGEWTHNAVVKEGGTLTYYRNGEEAGSAEPTNEIAPNVFWIGGDPESGWGGELAAGEISDVQLWIKALSEAEVLSVMAGLSQGAASSPNPENEAIEVSIDADLSWKSGQFAQTHDVYLSTVMDDANDAEVDTPLDALLQAGHDVNSYELDRLEYGQTYYWRVDEVNGAPDYSIYRGELWNFTTELLAYPIDGDKIIVTASSSAAGQEAENTIDGSGIDPNTDQHSNRAEDMWASEAGDTTPWIQYEFDTLYKLHSMLVWNYNGSGLNTAYGAAGVTIEYSADGDNWETSDVTEFTQASGTATYEAGDTVEFGDVAVKYVKISISSNQAPEALAIIYNSAGLSEVSFLAIPTQARFPVPDDGTVDVNIYSPTLSWTAGRGAVEHNVNFDGASMATGLTETSYTVPMTLDLSTTYEWSVDEVNGADVWPGSPWSFTTEDYIVVEDFEDYNDTVGFRVYDDAWLDGYDIPSNGALIGHGELPIMEEGEVYAGDQSAPVYFDNTSAASSEVYIDPINLDTGRDLSVGSPQALVLWVYGQDPNAAAEQLYVKVNNTKILSDVDLSTEDWTPAIFDISGMNLGNVSNLAVGLERIGATGGVGLVYIDEIRLYGSTEALVEEE